MARVAINGLGRIGRAMLKIVVDTPGLDLVVANDIAPPDSVAYLLKYDTVYGRYEQSVESAYLRTRGDGRGVFVRCPQAKNRERAFGIPCNVGPNVALRAEALRELVLRPHRKVRMFQSALGDEQRASCSSRSLPIRS